MRVGLGGNPYGPAGTGKTESVKALGGLFGRQVLVFNCDEGNQSCQQFAYIFFTFTEFLFTLPLKVLMLNLWDVFLLDSSSAELGDVLTNLIDLKSKHCQQCPCKFNLFKVL